MHLFVYGSLMFEPVWSRLAQNAYAQYPARLPGFVRRKVRHDVYPVVFRSQNGDDVEGLVYLDVTEADIKRLDAFEGEFYDRQDHTVVVEGRRELVAAVYVLKDCYRDLIDHVEWDPQWFAAEGLPHFLGEYKGF